MIYLNFMNSYPFISVSSKLFDGEILNRIESELNQEILMKMYFLRFQTIHLKKQIFILETKKKSWFVM